MNTDTVLTETHKIALALSYCHFLKGGERLRVSKAVGSFQELTAWKVRDFERVVERHIRTAGAQLSALPHLVRHGIQTMRCYQIKMVFKDDDAFPSWLREISDVPFVLFYRGTLPCATQPIVGMVGTRTPTGEGVRNSLAFSKACAESGIAIVSGLARGIDGFCHKGALAGGGYTLAVLACGVDQLYPRSNSALAARIIETGGCILSEYAPSEHVMRYRFPERNRLISGLARSLVVMEAPKKSGALITALCALEQGRDVYVYEPLLESLQNEGGRLLHAEGARALTCVQDMFDDWEYA